MRKIISIFLITLLVIGNIPAFADGDPVGIRLYVSVTGDDNNPGTQDSPLASLQGARDRIRTLSQQEKENGVTVYFRGGEYKWENQVDMDMSDSGTKDAKIVYRNFPGETPVMSGGYKVSANAFQKVTDRNVLARIPDRAKSKVRVLDLKKLGIDDKINSFGKMRMSYYLDVTKPIRGMEIFVGDEAMEPARWPNKDKFDISSYLYIEKVII